MPHGGHAELQGELREAKSIEVNAGLSATHLATLGTRWASVLPALEQLFLCETVQSSAGPKGVQRLAEKLGAGALPAVTRLVINHMYVTPAPRHSPPPCAGAPCRGSRPSV